MGKTKKIAVVLSGCGVYDGSEIHEATLSLYFIASHGSTYHVFAPDITQHHVINHLNGKEMKETRNVLVESARIARGNIKPLSEFKPSDFDAILFPGGYGAAKNLSDWAFKGPNGVVNPEVEWAIKEMVSAGKPIGGLCISPVIFAKVLGDVEITIGDELPTIKAIESLGARHVKTGHGEIVIDKRYKLVTTPCYMLNASIDQVGKGIEAVVNAILEMA